MNGVKNDLTEIRAISSLKSLGFGQIRACALNGTVDVFSSPFYSAFGHVMHQSIRATS